MAIDLNRPIGAPSAASTALPTKTTMNLLVRERRSKGIAKYALAGLGLLLLVGLFAKFAVADVFGQVDLKRAELAAAQQEHSAVEKQIENYDALQEEYLSYTGVAAADTADALQVMNMVSRVVQPVATITSTSVSGGTLVINVKGVSLDGLGKLADALRAEELVDSVAVSNAVDAKENVAGLITVKLVSSAEKGGK